MARHIGIAAVSPEGSALCYREIFRHAKRLIGERGHPTVTLHNEPFEEYISAALRDDWHAVGQMLTRSAQVLAAAGAEFCIVPDNLMQYAIHLSEVGSPVPWLKMTDLVAEAIERDGRKRVGLVGTRMVMSGTMYQVPLGLKGIELLRPEEKDIATLDSIIFRELIYGIVKRDSQAAVLDIIRQMAERGCEGVILGSSEAPLVITEANSPVPVYDATAVLAEGAVRASIGQLPLPA